ncbi:MAG: type IV pilus assembly protein PilQ [Desulfobacteraceae bacterium Eth-SRB1]|nr:MAG: type IV pilus assembly protein PilQ [Desulfobacteraceae bacterium Eth-SRB1]
MFYKITKFSKSWVQSILLIILLMLFAGCASSKAPKQADQKQTEQKVGEYLNLITDISTAEGSESLAILIKAERLLTYTSVKQPVPLGVALYFPETALGKIKTAQALDGDIVASIKASELTENGHTSRIEIALKKDAPYEVFREGNGLQISFAKGIGTKASAEPVAEKEKNQEDKLKIKPAEVKMPAEIAPGEDKYKKPALVNRLDFSSEDAGKSTIIIGTTKPVKYKMDKAAEKRLKLILFNTSLPDYRKRPLITTRFNSAVNRITPMQTPALKTRSAIVIELRESVPYYIEQAKDLLLVHFDASSIPPRPAEQADLPSWKKVVTQATAGAKPIEDKGLLPKVTRKYTGEKIALDFYDTDIKNVFLILREVSGKNFAIDKDVTGRVTITLAKPVPWDQALDLVLKMNQLGKTSEGNIIRIATLETLKKEEGFKQAEIIAAQKVRKEQEALEPLITEYIDINYATAEIHILPHLEKIISKDRGSAAVDEGDKSTGKVFGGASVSADERTNTIIMTDTVAKIRLAREIIKKLDKVTPQVMIEARIVEASTNFSREIGVDWSAKGGIQGDAPNAGIGPQRSYDTLGGTYGYDIAMNFPITAVNPASVGFNFLRIAGSPLLLNAELLASESEGEVKIISSPKILTLNKKTATIEQGLEYPQNTRDDAGNIIPGESKDLTLKLDVTPQVTPDNRVLMNINIQNDGLGSLAPDGTQIFTTKSANTDLLVNDGETIVIGGIRKTTKSAGEIGLPWLSKVPILGWLFKSQTKLDDKEELLIFITPKIIRLEQRDMQNLSNDLSSSREPAPCKGRCII